MQQRGNHLKNMNTITKYILGFVALVAAIFFFVVFLFCDYLYTGSCRYFFHRQTHH